GVSEWTAAQIGDALGLADDLGLDRLVSKQPEYSILRRRIEAEVLPFCTREGVGQVVWSPLAQGVLTGKYRKGLAVPADSRAASRRMGAFVGRFLTDEVLDAVERLRVVADEAGLTMAQLALAWVLREDEVASAIVGGSRPEQLDDTCAAAGRRLDAEVLAAVDKAVAGVLEPCPRRWPSSRPRRPTGSPWGRCSSISTGCASPWACWPRSGWPTGAGSGPGAG